MEGFERLGLQELTAFGFLGFRAKDCRAVEVYIGFVALGFQRLLRTSNKPWATLCCTPIHGLTAWSFEAESQLLLATMLPKSASRATRNPEL